MANWIQSGLQAIGNFFGFNSAKKEREAVIKAQKEMNYANMELQKEFAQNSIQWKVQDAKKAGIHPLAALGASGYTAAPSFVAPDTSRQSSEMRSHFGAALSRFQEEQMESQSEMDKLQLENQRLENLKLSKEIAQIGQSPTSKAFGNGAPPSSGVDSNSPHSFDRTMKVGQDMQVTPQPNGTFLLGYAEGSSPAEGMSDGGLLGVPVAGWADMLIRFSHGGYIKSAEDAARKSGYLKPDEVFTYYPSVYGLLLEKTKKGKPGWFEDMINQWNPSKNRIVQYVKQLGFDSYDSAERFLKKLKGVN